MCAHVDARNGNRPQEGLDSHKTRQTRRNKSLRKQWPTLKSSQQANKATHFSVEIVMAPPKKKTELFPNRVNTVHRGQLTYWAPQCTFRQQQLATGVRRRLHPCGPKPKHEEIIIINQNDNITQTRSTDNVGKAFLGISQGYTPIQKATP